MRSLLGLLVVVTTAGFQAAPKTTAPKAVSNATSGARMVIEPEVHDFGKAKQDLKLEKEFTIRNTGTELLSLGRISTSCGCTVAEPEVREIKPGQSTTMKVTLETRRYSGPIERTVAISSNDPRRVATIKVKVFVEGTAQD